MKMRDCHFQTCTDSVKVFCQSVEQSSGDEPPASDCISAVFILRSQSQLTAGERFRHSMEGSQRHPGQTIINTVRKAPLSMKQQELKIKNILHSDHRVEVPTLKSFKKGTKTFGTVSKTMFILF